MKYNVNYVLCQLDRPVGAVLLSREGVVLGAAINQNAKNRTRHAEVNLLREWGAQTGRPLPVGSTIVTTLKPCKMCAGGILSSAELAEDLSVFYLHDDPGPAAQNLRLKTTQLVF